jgi:hypothetical protein
MPKDWIDKAAASGDWSIASQKAAAALRKRHREGEEEEEEVVASRFERLTPDEPLSADGGDDAVQEYIEDVNEDALPDDEVAIPDDAPVSTRLARRAELALRAEAERQRVLARQAERKINIALEAAKHEEALRRWREDFHRRLEEGECFGHLMSEEEVYRYWHDIAARYDITAYDIATRDRRNWAGISDPVGPPPDPPPNYGARVHLIGNHAQWWRYKHRGVLSAVEPGRHFGPSPPGTPPENPYYGYAPRMGRPRNPNKLSAAEKQRAYRQRRKGKEAAK